MKYQSTVARSSRRTQSTYWPRIFEPVKGADSERAVLALIVGGTGAFCEMPGTSVGSPRRDGMMVVSTESPPGGLSARRDSGILTAHSRTGQKERGVLKEGNGRQAAGATL